MPTPSPAPVPPEALGPALARLLAPYIITELRALGILPASPAGASASPGTVPDVLYDAQTCDVFASRLGDNVLRRALVMFRLLALAGQLDSTALLGALPEANTTPHLASLLTSHLRHRCKTMGLRYPWRATKRRGRVVWVDFDGIAGRMVQALEREEQARQIQQHPAVPTTANLAGNGPAAR